MKKINLKEIKTNLTKFELTKIMAGSGDINNLNSVLSCNCGYNNNSAINNTNEALYCRCWCRGT